MSEFMEAIKALTEENDRLEMAYHDLANNMVYEGNSISWTKSKADWYKAALGEAWTALGEAGIQCDGQTTLAEGIKKLHAQLRNE